MLGQCLANFGLAGTAVQNVKRRLSLHPDLVLVLRRGKEKEKKVTATNVTAGPNFRGCPLVLPANEYPLHVVTDWLANTEKVASKHYLQTTAFHFEQAQRAKTGAAMCQKYAAAISGKSRGVARNKATIGSYVASDRTADG